MKKAADIEPRCLGCGVTKIALQYAHREAAKGIKPTRTRQTRRRPKSRHPRMLKDTTTATNVINGKEGQLFLVWTNIGEMTQATPTTARRVSNDWKTAGIRPRITINIENITARHRLVDRINTSKQDSNRGGLHLHLGQNEPWDHTLLEEWSLPCG